MTILTLIAAVARDGGIGRGNELLVRIPADMAHFKALTLGHTVIMGRKTWDSIPARFRPLPGRRNLVLSRQPGLRLEGAECFGSLDESLGACAGEAEVFVMGGAQVYAEALPRADRLELTEIDATFEADAYFPRWDGAGFVECSRAHHAADATPAAAFSFDFVRYERANS